MEYTVAICGLGAVGMRVAEALDRGEIAGMQLSADEIDLIDAWFAGGTPTDRSEPQKSTDGPPASTPQAEQTPDPSLPLGERTARWWQETAGARVEDDLGSISGDNDRPDDFPRIVRNRLKA